jgi:polyhydroxyalkanoate synthesis repressor PhaR
VSVRDGRASGARKAEKAARASRHASPDPGGVHVIKRYGNRRLYDARLSRCVTIEEIAQFVRRGEEVQVIDADTGDDITRRTLVQILLEEPHRRPLEMLPLPLLRMLFTLRDDAMERWLEQYLTAGTDWLERQLSGVRTAAEAMQSPLEAMMPWLHMMPGAPGFGGGFGASAPQKASAPASATGAASAPAGAPGSTPPPSARAADEDLRSRVEELQRQLADLAGRFKRR